MKRLYQFLGSLPMAIILLTSLGIALAFGTWHEAIYGTPAAQHYFYRATWFQTLLVFLVVNLVVSALHRYPWKRHHIGFVMTHLGIITILLGNLLGIWFGVEGVITIPEGESRDSLELSQDLLWVQPQNPGTPYFFPLHLNVRPWVHEVNQTFEIDAQGKPARITIDRYFPNTTVTANVVSGKEEFPAVHLELSAQGQTEEAWLFSRDPERFGFRWGPVHVLFFEVNSDKELEAIEQPEGRGASEDKGTLRLVFSEPPLVKTIPVDSLLGKTIAVEGTLYTLSLKDYFPDFMITEEGLGSRSDEPRNPALSFILKGPEGEEAFLVFALHPEFEERHGLKRILPVKASYEMATALPPLPPSLIGIVRSPNAWRVVMTSPDGKDKKSVALSLAEAYQHPWHDLSFRILEQMPAAQVVREFHLKDNDVRQQAIHVIVEQQGDRKEEWIAHGGVTHLTLGKETVVLSYQPVQKPLPFSVSLLDFRKKEYPGTSIASSFESDLEIRDDKRGLRLLKTVSMNNPMTYRGYTMFQASYIVEPVETTVLSVRKDPGTPVVYGGFVTVVIGMILMFCLRADADEKS